VNYETIAALATAVVALITAIIQHFRMTALPEKIKAEIKAEATLAAALVLADALVAAAKIKADANALKGN
jgi:uncharacterized membrane protein YjfL (UPF0719 family)